MIMEKVQTAAQPFLEGKTVKDLVIGISLIGCQLDDDNVGVSYMLRDELPNGCSAFPYAQEVIGKPALEIAGWSVTGENDLQRGIGSSVLTAATYGQEIPDDDLADMPFGIRFKKDDTVGMIGLIKPLADQISQTVKEFIAFDKGMPHHKNHSYKLHPVDKQAELLPDCDLVILSGTTTINGSIDALLKMCSKARLIVMVGPSTPMFPMGWRESPLTHLAGSWWGKEDKGEIFKIISLAGGVRHLQPYMQKKVVAVK